VQQAALVQARAGYRSVVLNALAEMEDAMSALRADTQRLAHLQQVVDSANRAALMARQRYASGLIDFQIVLETQRSQLAIQDSVAQADANVSSDQVRLFNALGGGWRPDESTRTVATPQTP
jgi:outer membrane protein TolC